MQCPVCSSAYDLFEPMIPKKMLCGHSICAGNHIYALGSTTSDDYTDCMGLTLSKEEPSCPICRQALSGMKSKHVLTRIAIGNFFCILKSESPTVKRTGSLQSLVQCPICSNQYDLFEPMIPKSTPCGHTFCSGELFSFFPCESQTKPQTCRLH